MSREYAFYCTERLRNQHSSINIFIAFDGIIVKFFIIEFFSHFNLSEKVKIYLKQQIVILSYFSI